MSERYLRKRSTSFVFKEMQFKTTLSFQFTTIGMTKTKNTDGNISWRGCLEERTLLNCCWEVKVVQSLLSL